jgi:glutamyl-tRNA synthetase
MILGHDGKKLSKRTSSVSITDYMDEGFLPEAVLNFLALLGWSFDDKTTVMGKDEIISAFALEDINKKAAMFDYEKLLFLNSQYIKGLSDKEFASKIIEHIKSKKTGLDVNAMNEKMMLIAPIIKERVKTVSDCIDILFKFFSEIKYESKMADYFKGKSIDAVELLQKITALLEGINDKDFNTFSIESSIRGFAGQCGLSLRKVAEPIRVAVWGEPVSPPLFETIEILGKKNTLKRLRDYLALISKA